MAPSLAPSSTDEPGRILRAWDAAASKLYTPCGTGSMVWRLWGEGRPTVLLHGGAGAWSHWVRNLEALIEDPGAGGRLVIAPDLPGLGESASPPRPYTPESIAAITAAGLERVLRRRLGRDREVAVDVCGFSFGGMVSGLVAERLGERTGRLVLIGASGLEGRFADLPPVARLPAGASASELGAVHRHNLAAMMIHDPERIDALALHIQAVNAPRTRVLSPAHALSAKLAGALRRSGVAFHSVWGEHCIFRPDLPRRRCLLASIRSEARFEVVAGAGHWAQYEAPAAVNPLLRELLAA